MDHNTTKKTRPQVKQAKTSSAGFPPAAKYVKQSLDQGFQWLFSDAKPGEQAGFIFINPQKYAKCRERMGEVAKENTLADNALGWFVAVALLYQLRTGAKNISVADLAKRTNRDPHTVSRYLALLLQTQMLVRRSNRQIGLGPNAPIIPAGHKIERGKPVVKISAASVRRYLVRASALGIDHQYCWRDYAYCVANYFASQVKEYAPPLEGCSRTERRFADRLFSFFEGLAVRVYSWKRNKTTQRSRQSNATVTTASASRWRDLKQLVIANTT